ncbi:MULTISPECIES: hypothetical protein [Streptomyces]|uniref:Uncharacterized protein n=1 Tax=Streptomyces pseudovenezuelae TaxID=67350 RepID=A0ABT6M317_9ACTN|nr:MULTISPECIES: hypothetical protein [Streptomyces]MDH6222939.1 hypothetical protein [Streptomyces pseudovenezuelae]MDQ1046333.1 hypothetical protein [Streptomyces sp. V4I2]
MSTLEFTGLDLDVPVGSKNRTATLVNSEQEALLTDTGLTPPTATGSPPTSSTPASSAPV